MENSSSPSPNEALLKNFAPFAEFSTEEAQKVLEQSREIHFKKGEIIEVSQAFPNEVALITKGRLENFCSIEGDCFHLGIIYANEFFNGPVLIDKQSNSKIKALEATTLLLIKKATFKDLEKKEIKKFLQTIKKFYENSVNNRAASNDQLIITMERTNNLLKEKNFASQFLFTLSIFFLTFLFSLDIIKYLSFNLLSKYREVISGVSIALFAIIIAYLVQTSNKPYTYFGIHLKNYKKHIIESLIFTFIVLITITLLKFFAIYFHILPEGKKLFEFKKLLTTRPWYGFIFYCLIVPLQQFIIRSGFQVPLQALLNQKNKSNIKTILLSTAAFGALHITFGIIITCIMLPIGFLWALLYDRQQGLIGVTVSHIILGLYSIIALNIFHLFD